MPSPFPGMDPYLEQNPIFQELHTQMLAEAQALLQPQLRPKYVARLERHLSEGGTWELEVGVTSLVLCHSLIVGFKTATSGKTTAVCRPW